MSKLKIKQTKDITLNNVVLKGGVTNNRIDFINNNSGIILTSPDETRWRLTINTNGQLITTTVDNPINYNPSIWLDARQVTYDNNNKVTTWNDSSGNNNVAIQGGTGSTTFGSTSFNGTQSIVFGGNNSEHMTFELGATISEATYFLVFEILNVSVSGANIISDADIQGGSNLNDKRVYSDIGMSFSFLRNGGSTNTESVSINTLNIMSVRWGSGLTSSYRINDGSWTEFTQDGGTDSKKFILGNWSDPTFGGGKPIEMNLSQVVIYDYLISDIIGDGIFNYFNNLYNIY